MPDDRPSARDARPAAKADAGPGIDVTTDVTTDAAANRAADHAGIDRLTEALVPALMAKLTTLNVGELEVREGDWRVRLRRPAGAVAQYGRRATDRSLRAHPGHEQHGHAPSAPEPHRAGRAINIAAAPSSNGSTGPGLAPVGPGRAGDGAGGAEGTAPEAGSTTARIATSPAVGVFQPGPRAVGGTRVRAGDRLGAVDMLGVPQEVVAPVDGIVIGVIVDAGTAVEYGQELIHLEPAVPAPPATPAEGR